MCSFSLTSHSPLRLSPTLITLRNPPPLIWRDPTILPSPRISHGSPPAPSRCPHPRGCGAPSSFLPIKSSSSPITRRRCRSRRAMLGIIRTVKSLQETNPLEPDDCYEKDGIHDHELFEFMSEVELDGDGMQRKARKAPWVAAERKMVFRREKKEREVTAAERILTEDELARLQGEARRMRSWVRAKKAGFMQEVVEEIERIWKKQELAMVKIVQPTSRSCFRFGNSI